jgi:hypothetical protein
VNTTRRGRKFTRRIPRENVFKLPRGLALANDVRTGTLYIRKTLMLIVNEWITSFIFLGLLLVAWGVGWSIGRARSTAPEDNPMAGKLADATMALLGLFLAFAVGMSLQKHMTRREVVVSDSNAIGDFYTTASLLKDPIRSQLQGVIRDYVDLRLQTAKNPREDSLESAMQQSEAMQARMTDLVREAVDEGTPLTLSLVSTLNELAGQHAVRITAIRDQVPPSIVLLLTVSGVGALLLLGRQQGAARNQQVLATTVLILLISMAFFVMLDLNQPGSGLIRVSQEPMQRLQSTIESGR